MHYNNPLPTCSENRMFRLKTAQKSEGSENIKTGKVCLGVECAQPLLVSQGMFDGAMHELLGVFQSLTFSHPQGRADKNIIQYIKVSVIVFCYHSESSHLTLVWEAGGSIYFYVRCVIEAGLY